MSKAAWKRAAFLAFGGTRGAGGHHRPHGLIRRALAAPVAQTRRASDEAAVPAKWARFSAVRRACVCGTAP